MDLYFAELGLGTTWTSTFWSSGFTLHCSITWSPICWCLDLVLRNPLRAGAPAVLYLLAVGLGACADLYLLVIGLRITWTSSIFGLLRSGTLRPGPLRPGALRPGLHLPGALLVTTMSSVANSTDYNILCNSNIPIFNGALADYREYRRRIKLYMGKMKLLKREAEGVLNMMQRSLMRLIAS